MADRSPHEAGTLLVKAHLNTECPSREFSPNSNPQFPARAPVVRGIGGLTFVMVREPAFFSNMECNIDIFHQFDHTTCGNAFCHKKKTQDRVVCEPLKFSQANTSGAEQANNRLKLLRKQLAYSSYATARLLLTHFIAWWNDRVKAREHTST